MPLISKQKRNHRKVRRKGNVDVISQLPDHLIHQILLKLLTKDSVKTSVLSTRWRYLWKHVPGLDFSYTDFGYHDLDFFVDRFLGFDKKSVISQFKLCVDVAGFSIDTSSFENWINIVVSRGLDHLVIDAYTTDELHIEMPIGICTCETLVHLKLEYVRLEDFDSVYLPRLKTMHLSSVLFSSDASLEKLISSSPALQVLEIEDIQNVKVLRVCSQTLISLSIKFINYFLSEEVDRAGEVIDIDASSLKYLCLERDNSKTIVLNRVGSSTKMNIDVISKINRCSNPNDISKKEEVFGNFLAGISKAIYVYSSLAPLPQFPNLTCLRASFPSAVSEMLPTFLASCPNLKSLYLEPTYPDIEKIASAAVPECMLKSLKYVEIKISIEKNSAETELVGYILGNAAVLTKLVLRLDRRCIAEDRCQLLEKLLVFPRRSPACQVFVLYG